MTIELSEETEIDVPAEQVWAIVADHAFDHEWRTGVASMVAEPPDIVEVGTTTAEVLRLGGRTWENDGEVVAVEPGRSFHWRTTSGARANGSRTIEPLDPGRCRVRLQVSVTPRGAERLLAPVLGRVMARNLRSDLQRLAELARQRDAVPGTSPEARARHA